MCSLLTLPLDQLVSSAENLCLCLYLECVPTFSLIVPICTSGIKTAGVAGVHLYSIFAQGE